jgi:hypothetical protein
MSPDVLIHADHGNAVEPARIVDEDTLAFGKDRVVRGVPRHPKTLGHAGHGEVLDDDPFQRPPQTPARQLRPRLSHLGRVLAPHVPAPAAPVSADPHFQRRRSPPERLVRHPPHHRVTRHGLAPATTAPPIQRPVGDDPAGQDRPVWFEALSGDFEAKLIKPGKRGQIRAGEGSVRHVEVFQMSGVGTFIFGRPRPLPGHRRADQLYTLNCEEPVFVNADGVTAPDSVGRRSTHT